MRAVLLRCRDDAEEGRIVELLHDSKTNVMRARGVVIDAADTRLAEPNTGIGRDQTVVQQCRAADRIVEAFANECLRHFMEVKRTVCNARGGLSRTTVVRLIEILLDLQQMNGVVVIGRIDVGQWFCFLSEFVEQLRPSLQIGFVVIFGLLTRTKFSDDLVVRSFHLLISFDPFG